MSKEELTPKNPVAPIDYINNLTIPLLGLFGNDDQNPSPEKVNQLEAELKRLGKNYEFHRYDGAGHSFWSYDRPAYRQQQAMDAKNNTLATPPKLRVFPRKIRFTDIGPGQQKTTRIQIESVGGAYTKFWMADSPAPWLKIVEAKSTTNDPLPLEVMIEAIGSGASQRRWKCNLPIRIENEKNKTQDEVALNIEMQESRNEPNHDPTVISPPIIGRFTLSNRSKILALILIPTVAGLIISLYLMSSIPFWILLGFATLYLTEKWLGDPNPKHKIVGIFYRIILNLGILSYIGFVIWSGVKLFSQQFMSTALKGSLVFLGECIFLVWLWVIVGKNSWRRPSMKLTIVALIAAFLVFSYAGVQPMADYKDIAVSHLSSVFCH